MSATAVPRPSNSATTEDSFSKSVVLLALLMIAQRLIGFARSFFVCDVLSPTEVGQWDLAFSFLMLAAPLAVLGIPGSFGRYISYFQKQGMRSAFFKQSLVASCVLALLAGLLTVLFRVPIAQFAFGSAESASLVMMLGIGLPVVIVFNFGSCWFSGLRLNRVVFRIQFVQVLFFFLFCVLFLTAFAPQVENVIWAYLLSCLFAGCLGVAYLGSKQPTDDARHLQSSSGMTGLDQGSLIWKRILPFATWVWVSNALINLFAVCDRLLIVNCSSLAGTEALALVGQYHSARILPMLMIAVGGMAGSMVTPYLSQDWERNRHGAVNDRLNLMIKMMALLSLVMAVFVYVAAPVLFQSVWENKFSAGQSLLPMTLAFCSFASLTLVAQKYFWCIERTWLSGLALAIGLLINLVLGVALIPSFGMEGIVFSTLVSHVVVFTIVISLAIRNGFQLDRGILICVPLMLTICLGPLATVLGLVVLAGLSIKTRLVFSDEDRQAAVATTNKMLTKLGMG